MRFRIFLLLLPLVSGLARAADLPALWAQRLKTVVAVEFYTETETERRPTVAYGTVIDRHGTIILPPVTVNPRVTPSQLKEFKVYRAGGANGVPAAYLGQDALTGWHYVRVEAPLSAELEPITDFAPAKPQEPAMAEDVWGIGLRNKDEDFQPYFLMSRVALIQGLPQRTAIALQEVAGPGLPVFNRAGEFVGLAVSSFGQSFVQFSRLDRSGTPVVLVNVEESSAFQVAAEVLPYLGRVPTNVFGRPLAWLGANGLQPIDPEVAKFLHLENQSAVVVSEVLEGSPAEQAGMKARDILLAIDGQPLPRLKPDRVVVAYVEREIERRVPGATMTLTVLRGDARQEIRCVLGDEPKLTNEAERRYFDRIGLTAREFVYADAVALRVRTSAMGGVIAHFVKPNGPAGVAGLHTDDWIKEIDGVEVKTFAAAAGKLAEIEADPARTEFVLLVSRGGETAVLRVKLR
ncbi:MAG: PDZ domain-containing protein [Verrucomicrobia bacterium]|nr:PDZ domain-containing protein [Verrucomicrobiota bacterium]